MRCFYFAAVAASFNKTIDATLFSAESDPTDANKVRDMGNKVGYIKNGTSITFNDFAIPETSIPTSVTITYSSAGAGGTVKFVADGYNSSRELGITLGEFNLPSTGGWNNFETVTFLVDFDFELNYLRDAPPLRLEFNNPDSSSYLFDVVSFEINNGPTPVSTPEPTPEPTRP